MLTKLHLLLHRIVIRFHRWDYLNPYNRTCSICGRNEVQYCASMSLEDWRRGWWEPHVEGDLSKHKA